MVYLNYLNYSLSIYSFMKFLTHLSLACCFCLTSCHLWSQSEANILKRLLSSQPKYFDTLLNNAEKHEIQIIYTQINRDEQNKPSFQTFTFGLDSSRYFYPASMVKFPVALLALEKLNQLKINGLDKDTPLHIKAARDPQEEVKKDTTSPNGLASIGHYIKKIFLVSNNDAFNRLYEFLGQQYINQTLTQKGYKDIQITHRLANSDFDEESNRYTNPIEFFQDEYVIYQQPEVYNDSIIPPLNLKNLKKGRAYINKDRKKVAEPFDFSRRNFMSLATMHQILQATIFPESVPPSLRFQLTEDDYNFLYKCMSMLPRESKHPQYKEDYHQDSFVKFILYGDSKDTIPPNIRIFNKVGLAYGFLTDNAYVVDFEAKTEFLISAVIYVNENKVLNDNRYEYEKIGFPFFQRLGQVIAEYEKTRPRQFLPDLSRFQVDYRE